MASTPITHFEPDHDRLAVIHAARYPPQNVIRFLLGSRERMRDPVIQCEFDGVTRDGREIVIHVAIGDAHEIPSEHGGPDPGFYVEVEPLMGRKRSVGTDSFTAMCFGIRLVRQALKIFVAPGGSVYFRASRSPIDLESPWFESVGGVLRPEFLQPDPLPPDTNA